MAAHPDDSPIPGAEYVTVEPMIVPTGAASDGIDLSRTLTPALRAAPRSRLAAPANLSARG